MESIRIDKLIENCIKILEPCFFNESKKQALYLISHITDIPYMKLLVPDNRQLIDTITAQKIYGAAKMRITGVPLQYITGKAFFMNEEYFVGKGVLIPRKETEILVEEAFGIISEVENPCILELCTGSGCITLSLLKMMDACGKSYKALATDISEDAIGYAEKNMIAIKPVNPFEILRHDIINEDTIRIKNYCKKYDMIISNPPYIKTDEIENLEPQVSLYEPFEALNGGSDGLLFYKKIASLASELLTDDGYLLFEIGFNQYEEVKDILQKTGVFEEINCRKDYSGNYRVIVARRFRK